MSKFYGDARDLVTFAEMVAKLRAAAATARPEDAQVMREAADMIDSLARVLAAAADQLKALLAHKAQP